MSTVIQKVDLIIKLINDVVSKNRHILLVGDIKVLEQCLDELEKLKEEIIKTNGVSKNLNDRIVGIVKLLDTFFGLAIHVAEFIDVIK